LPDPVMSGPSQPESALQSSADSGQTGKNAELLRGLYYALRTGTAAGIATAISQTWHVDRGLWIAVSAVVVIQPDRHATMAKSLSRVIGTVVGAVTATLAATLLPFSFLTVAMVVCATVGLAWQFQRLREPLPLAAITAILVFTLDSQDNSLTVGLWRFVEIVGGVAIGAILAAIPLPGERLRK
jgi:uncharacterized membrane protein YccC